MGWTTRVQFPTEAGNFFPCHLIQTGSGTTQPPSQWVSEFLFPGEKRPGLKLIIHFHLVPRLMHGAVSPLSNTSS